jgi:hypothetical protein
MEIPRIYVTFKKLMLVPQHVTPRSVFSVFAAFMSIGLA